MTVATKMRFGVVIFPGSNCDTDAYHALHDVMGQPVDYVWHQETDLSGYDCIIVPGGSVTATICAPARWPGSPR